MTINNKSNLKKYISIVSIFTMLTSSLYANENARLMSTLWQRQLGNCTESYLFFQDKTAFAFFSSTGKKVMGNYLLERVYNSNRLKFTFFARGDNQFVDCFGKSYDLSQRTIIQYMVIDSQNRRINLSNTPTGNFFGFYSLDSQLSQQESNMWFNALFTQLSTDMQNNINRLQNAYQQQQNRRSNSLSTSDMIGMMDRATQKRKNAQAVVDEKLKYTSPEKADEIRGQMLKDNWRRMDARTEQNRVEQIENNRIQELNRQEDIQADYYNGY